MYVACAHKRKRRLRFEFGLFREEKHLCASQPPKSAMQSKLQPSDSSSACCVLFFLFFSSSSFSLPLWLFQLPYFVILWSPPGGNFCAGYDLKELANHAASLKLEQDVTKGPGPMVSAALRCLYLYILYDFMLWLSITAGGMWSVVMNISKGFGVQVVIAIRV